MKRLGIMAAALAVVAGAAVLGRRAALRQRAAAGPGVPAPSAEARGRALYAKAGCAACHGADGRGDGPAAEDMAFTPTDFHRPSAYRRGASPAAIASSIKDGVTEQGTAAMPAFPSLGEAEVSDLAAYVASLEEPGPASAVSVTGAWVRAVPPSSQSTAAYMTIENRGSAAVALRGATTPVARSVELHRMSMEGGMMGMRPASSIPIAPGGRVALAPGGYHAMLMGLSRPLAPGQRVPLVLDFGKAGRVDVDAVVGDGPPAP